MLFKYIIEDAEVTSLQAGFSVPKKRFKRAVDRNKLKRRIREVHRLKQHILKDFFLESPKKISILYIYAKNEVVSYEEVDAALISFYSHLMKPRVVKSL